MSASARSSDPGLTRRTALAVSGAAVALCGAAAVPRRIVSMNPCLDAILVRVADRGQIAALSHYSRDPGSSSIAAIAATLPFTHGAGEEIVALSPDLILTNRFAPKPTLAAFQKLGLRTALFDVPETVEASLAQVRQVGRIVGRPARGEALADRIAAAIAAAAPPPGARPLSAIVYQSNGFASAQGTLVDEMMRRTGFVNAASRYGLKRSGNLALEQIIADPPDVLLAGQAEPGAPTWADRVLGHPALRAMAGHVHKAAFPQRLIYCGGPVLIETAAMLAQARRRALAARA